MKNSRGAAYRMELAIMFVAPRGEPFTKEHLEMVKAALIEQAAKLTLEELTKRSLDSGDVL